MNRWKAPVLATVALSLAACASLTVDVEHEFDPEADFAAYRTYDWMPSESRRVDLRARDPMVDERIRNGIASELQAKGLRPIDSNGEPDIRVGYLLVLEDEVESQSMYETSAPDWSYRTYGPATLTTRTSTFTTGALIIDIFDEGEKALVWRGGGEGMVDQTQDLDKRRALLDKAIKEILAAYPPGG